MKEDQHCQEVAGICAVASFTADFTCQTWLIRSHVLCRIGLLRVLCVRHATACEAIGAMGLLNHRDGVTLHVAMDGLGIRGCESSSSSLDAFESLWRVGLWLA